jgi:thiosulfate/3-mercaptopyruvate sulfurtransferase
VAFETLVDARTLREHLDDPAWIVIDCRHDLADHAAGARAHQREHVPGAYFARVEDDLSGGKTGTNGRHPLPEPHAFAAFLASFGVNDDTQIVAYDNGGDMFASRLWFLARWIGHSAVAVLDGGIAVWKSAGFPLTDVEPARRPQGNLHARPSLIGTLDAAAVRDALANDTLTLLDARAPERYAGTIEPLDRVAGHIPGAKNRFYKANFNDDGTFKAPTVLREEFAPLGDAARVANYCGSGVSAAANVLAMHVAGLRGARIYPGSWSEWCSDPTNPVER